MTNKPNRIENVIIIGGGPAGMTAAIYLARAGLSPLVFAGSPPGGQLMWTTEMENFPGHESIMGPELVKKMREQAKKLGARIVDENVVRVDFKKRPFKVYLPNNEARHRVFSSTSPPKGGSPKSFTQKQVSSLLLAKTIIIATGAKARWLGLESEKRLRGKGVSACATCDGFFFRNKVVGVVGGGDVAMEQAMTLTKFASKVYLIHRRNEFRASKVMQQRVLNNPKIEVIWSAKVEEVLGEKKVEGVRLIINKSNFLTSELASRHSSGPLAPRSSSESEESLRRSLAQTSTSCKNLTSVKKIKLDGLFVAIGHKPDTDIFVGNVKLDDKGYIVTSARLALELAKLKTSSFAKASEDKQKSRIKNKFDFNYQYMTLVEGVFAAGDCADNIYQQAIVAAGTGAATALEIERWLGSVS